MSLIDAAVATPEVAAQLPPFLINSRALLPQQYSPATMEPGKLRGLMDGHNPWVQRLVIDTEDAVLKEDVPQALENIATVLEDYEANDHTDVFVRVRDFDVAEDLLSISGIRKIKGLILPKVDAGNFDRWMEIIDRKDPDAELTITPILESEAMTDMTGQKQRAFHDKLLAYKDRVDSITLGGNDLMQLRNTARRPGEIVWKKRGVGTILDMLLVEFGTDFVVTAPVYDQLDDLETLQDEVKLEEEAGVLGKLSIFPAHMPVITEGYAVPSDRLDEMKKALAPDIAAVSRTESGRMLEPTTHNGEAMRLITQAILFNGLDAAETAELRQLLNDYVFRKYKHLYSD